jgi:hypothetical protein
MNLKKTEEIVNAVKQEKIDRDVLISDIVVQPKNDIEFFLKNLKASGGALSDVAKAYSFEQELHGNSLLKHLAHQISPNRVLIS